MESVPTVTLQFKDGQSSKEFVEWWMEIVKAEDKEAAKDKAALAAKTKADTSHEEQKKEMVLADLIGTNETNTYE